MRQYLSEALVATRTTVVQMGCERTTGFPSSRSWRDAQVAEVSTQPVTGGR